MQCARQLMDRSSMLAILLFAFFHAKNEEMPKPNAEKKKHRNWGFCQEELFRGREKLYD